MITAINPDRVYPVHTEHPEVFKEFFNNVALIEQGKKYMI